MNSPADISEEWCSSSDELDEARRLRNKLEDEEIASVDVELEEDGEKSGCCPNMEAETGWDSGT